MPTRSTEPCSPQQIVEHVRPGADVIVPLANGEPVALLDALEAAAEAGQIERVRVHQMHALADRRYLAGAFGDRLRHVSYFLSHATRDHYRAGTVELVPNHFSDVAQLLRERCPDPLVIAAASLPDRHGYFSLGTSADYAASFIGRARFFLEANAHMPRTFGRNQLHVSQLVGWCRHDHALETLDIAAPGPVDGEIAALVAERVPDGATLQVGIGGTPNAILAALADHRDLGIHTELISDGLVELIEAGVANGVRKRLNRTKAVGTFALGSQRVYDFVDQNTAVELWPASYVNAPRIIGREPGFVSINAAVEIDLLGQCASETIGGRYWSSSGGQADFAQGAMFSEGGMGFVVLPSTARSGAVSRIVGSFQPATVVTTLKNTVDQVVTEWGVAELRGRTVRERARALIAVAHPEHRDALARQATSLGYV
ncbi:MAG: propionyl-CoA--succinate CoA transferase [Acidimicrobiia bacterium]|nr:propionyl-CoA--succinate CoA transferase [Acidimicrobiia bacterium]